MFKLFRWVNLLTKSGLKLGGAITKSSRTTKRLNALTTDLERWEKRADTERKKDGKVSDETQQQINLIRYQISKFK